MMDYALGISRQTLKRTNNEANRNEGKRTVPCKVLENPQTKKREAKATRKAINSDGGCETPTQRKDRVRCDETKQNLARLNGLGEGKIIRLDALMRG